jgi:hypothetical protein
LSEWVRFVVDIRYGGGKEGGCLSEWVRFVVGIRCGGGKKAGA